MDSNIQKAMGMLAEFDLSGTTLKSDRQTTSDARDQKEPPIGPLAAVPEYS